VGAIRLTAPINSSNSRFLTCGTWVISATDRTTCFADELPCPRMLALEPSSNKATENLMAKLKGGRASCSVLAQPKISAIGSIPFKAWLGFRASWFISPRICPPFSSGGCLVLNHMGGTSLSHFPERFNGRKFDRTAPGHGGWPTTSRHCNVLAIESVVRLPLGLRDPLGIWVFRRSKELDT